MHLASRMWVGTCGLHATGRRRRTPLGVTGQFEFRKTLWGRLVLRVEEEVKPFWQSKPKRRWRDAHRWTSLQHLIDIGRKSRPASQLSPHKEPEPATDLSAPADAV